MTLTSALPRACVGVVVWSMLVLVSVLVVVVVLELGSSTHILNPPARDHYCANP